MHLIAALDQSAKPMSELAEIYQPYHASGELNRQVADVAQTLAKVREAYTADAAAGAIGLDDLDGLTIDHWDASPRWWANVRGSNTEPLLRLNVEAADFDVMVKVRDGLLALLDDLAATDE
jgi:phosphomannomutase